MWFRRFLYIPDDTTVEAMPMAGILFVNDFALDQSLEEKLYIVGSGRDLDRMNGDPFDIKYTWFDDNGAILCKIDDYDDDNNPIYECEKDIEVKASDMEPGMNHIHMKVLDNDGNWSKEVVVSVFVAEHLSQLYLPSIVR
jgi:hypothetical protein